MSRIYGTCKRCGGETVRYNCPECLLTKLDDIYVAGKTLASLVGACRVVLNDEKFDREAKQALEKWSTVTAVGSEGK